MMKTSKTLLAVTLALNLCVFEKKLFAKRWGVGVALFDINGLSAKKIWNKKNNADLNLGWHSHDGETKLIVSAHYNWVSRGYIKLDDTALDAYLGVGIKIPGKGEHIELRTPFGVSYFLGFQKKIEVFGAIIPGMTIYPSTALRLSLAIGGRFYI